MRRIALAAALATTSTFAFAEAPKVVTDIGPVQALVSQIMGEAGTPTQILPPNASPHGYALRPSEARAISNADLIFWVGEELTPQLERAIESIAPDTPEFALLNADGVERLEYREGPFLGHDDHDDHAGHDHDEDKHAGHDHGDEKHAEHDHDEDKHAGHGHDHGEEKHAKHDHDEHKHAEHDHDEDKHAEHGHEGHGHDDHHGHDHDGVDPHAWLSPDNLAVWAKVIATELSAKDPDNAGTYWANATAEIARIEALHEELKVQLVAAHDKPFLVFHDAYQYFEHDFGIEAGATLLSSEAERPSAEALAEVREELIHMAEEGPVCIFSEPQFDTSLVESVAEGTEIRSGILDPLGSTLPQDANLHRAILSALAKSVVDCVAAEPS